MLCVLNKAKIFNGYLLRSASLDVEPVYTFRGHLGPVLCLAMSGDGDKCYSGGIDGTIRIWNVPSSNIDPYDSYGEFWFNRLRLNSWLLFILLATFYRILAFPDCVQVICYKIPQFIIPD